MELIYLVAFYALGHYYLPFVLVTSLAVHLRAMYHVRYIGSSCFRSPPVAAVASSLIIHCPVDSRYTGRRMAVLAYEYHFRRFEGFDDGWRALMAFCARGILPVHFHKVCVAVGANRIAHKGVMDLGYSRMAVCACLGGDLLAVHLVDGSIMALCTYRDGNRFLAPVAVHTVHRSLGVYDVRSASMAFIAIDILCRK